MSEKYLHGIIKVKKAPEFKFNRDNIQKHISYAVFCPNWLECDSCIPHDDTDARTKDVFIKMMRHQGWKKNTDDGLWYCKKCHPVSSIVSSGEGTYCEEGSE